MLGFTIFHQGHQHFFHRLGVVGAVFHRGALGRLAEEARLDAGRAGRQEEGISQSHGDHGETAEEGREDEGRHH